MFSVLDLFSGIGGFSLGLERTGGFKTIAFCEIEPFCRRVLAKHWPEVPCYDDIRSLTAERLCADGLVPDVLCGGFPCQDISVAGRGAGMAGERSGLWSEYARLVGELRPRYVIVENVAALLARGIDRVLGDLAAWRYDAEWYLIPAAAVGAPHLRERIWIVAYSRCIERQPIRDFCEKSPKSRSSNGFGNGDPFVPDADKPRLEGWLRAKLSERPDQWIARTSNPFLADADRYGGDQHEPPRNMERQLASDYEQQWNRWTGEDRGYRWWSAEPDVGRVANGVPARVDRLRGLGNAVVPQIPEMIGRAILAYETAQNRI